MINNQCTCH